MTEADQSQNRETLGQRPLLRDVLAELTFRPGRALPSCVKNIDLGVFCEEAMVLSNDSFLDPENRSSGKMIYVTGGKKVLVPIQPSKSYKHGVLSMQGEVSKLPKKIAESKNSNDPYLAMLMHSFRNTDYPLPATGLGTLLIEDKDLSATAALLIAGKTRNMLFCRGQNSPQLSRKESNQKVKLWMLQMGERIAKLTTLQMGKEERLEVASRAATTLLRQICEKYDLRFFSGETGEAIVKEEKW